eukprot:scaffold34653_cov18-Tisochrysis_lutea.AAC.1
MALHNSTSLASSQKEWGATPGSPDCLRLAEQSSGVGKPGTQAKHRFENDPPASMKAGCSRPLPRSFVTDLSKPGGMRDELN